MKKKLTLKQLENKVMVIDRNLLFNNIKDWSLDDPDEPDFITGRWDKNTIRLKKVFGCDEKYFYYSLIVNDIALIDDQKDEKWIKLFDELVEHIKYQKELKLQKQRSQFRIEL